MATQIFVSSVQSEFAVERRAIKDYVHGDPFLSRHFRVFIFEDVPAQDRSPRDVYVDEVDRSAVYVGLFGSQYGFEELRWNIADRARIQTGSKRQET